ncbi:aminotransferase class I/II-fold pyridoxal phosphate-dependent enzyme [Streptomyces sp. NPDC093707]|uniref:aminotransferase class I/II-fold pyridoxal phosphate-dependent enzyme n=1 Tax=Streptomyces sp. NPDC093707 TaxID=3154984 RepID=UPI00344EA461
MNEHEIPARPARLTRAAVPGAAGDALSARAADEYVRQAVREKARGRDAVGGPGALVLDTTHFDTVRFPPPPWALPHFTAAAGRGELAYTPYRGEAGVRCQVAQAVSAFMGVPLDPDREVVLTPGTQAALFAALSATVEEGGRVAVPDPDYLFDERIINYLGAHVDRIPLHHTPSGPGLDLQALAAAARGGARVLLLSHPNNPTGAVYSPQAITQIAKTVQQHGMTLIADQLYARLVYDGPLPHFAAEPALTGRCITLLGPSKTESLSGYRLGVVTAPPHLADAIEDVLALTALRAPAYSQHVLTPWLREDTAWVNTRVEELRALREMTTERLREVDYLTVTPQAGTAYLFPDISALALPDHEVAARLVRDARVLVSPGYQFGPAGHGHFRLCYARDEQQWARALDRITATLHDLGKEQGL